MLAVLPESFRWKKLKDIVFFWLWGFFSRKNDTKTKCDMGLGLSLFLFLFFKRWFVQFMFRNDSKNAQRILTDVLGVWTVVFKTEHETEIANKIKRLNLQWPFMDVKGCFQTTTIIYTRENYHGTWKSPVWKGTSSSKPSFFGFMLIFRGVSPSNRFPTRPKREFGRYFTSASLTIRFQRREGNIWENWNRNWSFASAVHWNSWYQY